MQSVIKRPCPATRIHFQLYGQPNVERKTTTGERHPAETRGRHICRPYSDYVNCIRRAGCPHPAASSRGGGQAPCRPQTPAEGSRPLPTDRPINECPPPAASSRGSPSTGSHPRRGRRPRRPGNLPPPPIPGKTSGPGMPGPYRAAVGKPHAVHKRPRRGQDLSLRTDPSTSAGPRRAAVRERQQKNRGDPFSRDCLGSLYKHISA